MAIGALNGLNPFRKTISTNVFGAAQNPSIFNTPTVQNGNTINPFASVNEVTTPIKSVMPVGYGTNYSNGLAPSSDLQNVYNGIYNGKPNILNQIAIA